MCTTKRAIVIGAVLTLLIQTIQPTLAQRRATEDRFIFTKSQCYNSKLVSHCCSLEHFEREAYAPFSSIPPPLEQSRGSEANKALMALKDAFKCLGKIYADLASESGKFPKKECCHLMKAPMFAPLCRGTKEKQNSESFSWADYGLD